MKGQNPYISSYELKKRFKEKSHIEGIERRVGGPTASVERSGSRRNPIWRELKVVVLY